jgi:hypothetical protein
MDCDLSCIVGKEVIVRVRKLGAMQLRKFSGTVAATSGHMVGLERWTELTSPSADDSPKTKLKKAKQKWFNTNYAYFHSIDVF